MTLWVVSFLLLLLSFPNFSSIWDRLKSHFFQQRVLDQLKLVASHLRILKESLESGLVPSREDWEKTSQLPEPWGAIFSTSLQSLREQGAPVLPSLDRMLQSIEDERTLLLEARTRSSQAFGQVLVSVMLVPIFGLALYWMLPELASQQAAYLSLLAFCLLLVFLAFYWMLRMMEDARFGGVASEKRTWLISSKLFFERMMASIAGGQPPDLAWSEAVRFLEVREPKLLEEWGVRIWDEFPARRRGLKNQLEESLCGFGVELRRAIQQSLAEGAASMDRLDAIYRNFLVDTRMKIAQELQVLPNHCLKPLFILVLPAVMVLLFGAMGMTVMRMME